MKIDCVWEHNGDDTLLHAANLPGAYTRGPSLEAALEKMPAEAAAYLRWRGEAVPEGFEVRVVQDAPCSLQVADADSDVLFLSEREPLSRQEYAELKRLALKSAGDFLLLYSSAPCKSASAAPPRPTFYGQTPATAREMYLHTKNVNSYYFGEIGVRADNQGSILDCRRRGFEQLEQHPDLLSNRVFEGSYGESWTLRKLLRRFIWHDRIHGKALYRMAARVFGETSVANPFCS